MAKDSKVKEFLKSKIFTLLVLLLLIVVFFWAFSKNHSFLGVRNITSILNSMAVCSLLAIAEAFLVISGEVDLSPGYIGTAAGTLLATVLSTTGLPWFIAVILGLALGVLFGLINAVLINKFGFQSFIATLAIGSFVVKGIAYIIPNGKVINIKNDTLATIGTGKIADLIPYSVVIAIVLLAIYGVILAKTRFGRSIYLCGGNKQAAYLAGLNPKKLSYLLFANSGMLGALGGMLYATRLKSGNLEGTNNYAFPALTAAILGGVSLGGGTGTMFGCFLGLLIINSFNNGLTIIGVSPFWQNVASGLLLLLALTLDYFANRKKKKKPARRVISKA